MFKKMHSCFNPKTNACSFVLNINRFKLSSVIVSLKIKQFLLMIETDSAFSVDYCGLLEKNETILNKENMVFEIDEKNLSILDLIVSNNNQIKLIIVEFKDFESRLLFIHNPRSFEKIYLNHMCPMLIDVDTFEREINIFIEGITKKDFLLIKKNILCISKQSPSMN